MNKPEGGLLAAALRDKARKEDMIRVLRDALKAVVEHDDNLSPHDLQCSLPAHLYRQMQDAIAKSEGNSR